MINISRDKLNIDAKLGCLFTWTLSMVPPSIGQNIAVVTFFYMGWSPGFVVTGDNSCLKGQEFESQRCILDGLFHIDLL